MLYVLLLAVIAVSQLNGMQEPWDAESMKTAIGNQRRSDDGILIATYETIAHKKFEDLTREDKAALTSLARNYDTHCILKLVCNSAMFKHEDLGPNKDSMLYLATRTVTDGFSNYKCRAKALKNVALLLENGAAQHEGRFHSFIGADNVFRAHDLTEKDFEPYKITKKDHLELIGLFAKHVKHNGFNEALKKELQEQKAKDNEWAQQIANVVVQNGVEQVWVDAILK